MNYKVCARCNKMFKACGKWARICPKCTKPKRSGGKGKPKNWLHNKIIKNREYLKRQLLLKQKGGTDKVQE